MSVFNIPQLSLDGSDDTKIDFASSHKELEIDLRATYDRPPLCLSIGEDDKAYNGYHYPLRFGTYGNISMIKGEEKARKSFLKSLLIANAAGGNANRFTQDIKIQGHNLEDKYIFDIDTEQDDYDSWLAATRIPNMCGGFPPNYKAIKLRDKTSIERLQYVEWLFMESEYRNKLGLVSIDGYVDLVKDFNNNIESTEFTEKLMKWSKVTRCHITGVLHLNPGSEKARGHLGTILQNKCETVVIIKDKGAYSEVTCQRARGKKFPNFCLLVNDNWLPEIIDNPEGDSNWIN